MSRYCFLITVFPWIVSSETILLWKWKMWKFSYSFRIMAIFYFINWILVAETIEGGKPFKGGNYSRKYGIQWGKLFKEGICSRKYVKSKNIPVETVFQDVEHKPPMNLSIQPGEDWFWLKSCLQTSNIPGHQVCTFQMLLIALHTPTLD